MEQLIISIGREYGSAGHEIAEKLAKRFDIDFYDRNMLDEIAAHKNVDVKELEKYDELPRKKIFSRKVRGYSNSPEEIIAQMQFGYLLHKAKAGKSFVIVGRCSESVLSEYECLISVFIHADKDFKVKRVMEKKEVSKEKALEKMAKHDRKRKAYHNHFSKGKWGDSKNYDITLNSSRLGIDETVDVLESYVRKIISK